MYAALSARPECTLSLGEPISSAVQGMDIGPLPTKVAFAVESRDLLKGQKAVEIMHNGCVYRLQNTKLGKLILTK